MPLRFQLLAATWQSVFVLNTVLIFHVVAHLFAFLKEQVVVMFVVGNFAQFSILEKERPIKINK